MEVPFGSDLKLPFSEKGLLRESLSNWGDEATVQSVSAPLKDSQTTPAYPFRLVEMKASVMTGLFSA